MTRTRMRACGQQNHPIQFYQGASLIGMATQAPYAINWSNVAAGNYLITVKAYNDKGDVGISAPVNLNVNAPPTVSLSSPASNAVYTAPATVTLSANAADSDGSIAKVDFFNGTALLATVTKAPYTFDWTNVGSGTYGRISQRSPEEAKRIPGNRSLLQRGKPLSPACRIRVAFLFSR